MSELGDVIETARRAKGLTQEQLAEKLGVKQATLSRYENDMRQPDDEALAALARELGVTPALLRHADRVRSGMAMEAHMRKRATAPPTVWKRLEAELNMLRFHSSNLLEQVNLKAKQYIPSLDPFEIGAEAAARMVRMQWRMPIGPVRSMTAWLEAAGTIMVAKDFKNGRVDGLSQWACECPVMLLNSKSPTDRLRLTMAHELGHLVLHSDAVTDDVEGDANAFAGEFLMPAEYIRPQLRNLKPGTLRALKLEYGVSMQALVERAFHLNLLSPAQRTSMYKMFGARGWRTSEPGSDELRPERPTLVELLSADLAASGMSTEEIAHLAGFADSASNDVFRPAARGGLRSV